MYFSIQDAVSHGIDPIHQLSGPLISTMSIYDKVIAFHRSSAIQMDIANFCRIFGWLASHRRVLFLCLQ